MANPWEGFCEWVRSQGGNLGNVLNGLSMVSAIFIVIYILGHQSTYSDIGSSTGDALSLHNTSTFFLSAWQVILVLLLIVWGALFVRGRNSNASDRKPERMPDKGNDEGGVGGLN